MDMNKVLDTLAQEGERKAATPPPFDPTAPYEFNTAPDNVGLPQEHAAYAKASCNACYGRGYETVIKPLVGTTVFGGLVKRERRTCMCVHKGYVRARKNYEATLKSVREMLEGE